MARGTGLLRRKVPASRQTVGEALLTPTRLYVRPVIAILDHKTLGRDVRAACHVTGGGIAGNLPRVIPPGLQARLEGGSWEIPPIFGLIQEKGHVPEAEMRRVFNLGVGFILVVAARSADRVAGHLCRRGIPAQPIGDIVKGRSRLRWT